jgi:hypothetical protein
MNRTDHAATDTLCQSRVVVVAADADAADDVTDALARHAPSLAVRTVDDSEWARSLLSDTDGVVVAGRADSTGADVRRVARDVP